MEKIKEVLLSLMEFVVTYFQNVLDDTVDILSGVETAVGFNVHSVWGTMNTIAISLRPFCYLIITICLLIEIAQVAQKVDVISWEHGIKLCLKMVITKVIIDVVPTFLRACWRQSNDWITVVVGDGNVNIYSVVMTRATEVIGQLDGLFTGLILCIPVLLVLLAVAICGLVVQAIALGRWFEIYIYIAISPLPCAFFPLGDGTGGGWSRITQKYLKSFIAICLQGVFMVLCFRLFGTVVDATFSQQIAGSVVADQPVRTLLGLCFTLLTNTILLVMCISRCGNWAKGIIDAM